MLIKSSNIGQQPLPVDTIGLMVLVPQIAGLAHLYIFKNKGIWFLKIEREGFVE